MLQYVVLGCGPAAISGATEIRALDPKAKITLVTREFTPFYLKPALADYAAQLIARKEIIVADAGLTEASNVEVRAGARVSRLYPHESRVLLSDGTSLYFDRLLIATGGAPELSSHAHRLRHKVCTLTTLADAERISRLPLSKDAWVLVAGAGRPGLETVRAMVSRGCRVVYLTSHLRFWPEHGLVSRGDVLAKLRGERVEVLFDEAVLDILDRDGLGYRVVTSSRRTLDVELLIEAGQLVPQTEFLEGSGLLVDGGVVVNTELRTNFETIYAAGDVARVHDEETGESRVNYGWQSAMLQGQLAGANLVRGGGRTVELDDTFFAGVHGMAMLERWRPGLS